jgi:hypothetical protein
MTEIVEGFPGFGDFNQNLPLMENEDPSLGGRWMYHDYYRENGATYVTIYTDPKMKQYCKCGLTDEASYLLWTQGHGCLLCFKCPAANLINRKWSWNPLDLFRDLKKICSGDPVEEQKTRTWLASLIKCWLERSGAHQEVRTFIHQSD